MSNAEPVSAREPDWSLRISRGDELAFHHLFDAYYQQLCRYATTLTGDADGSEDLVQALFVWIWEHRDGWTIRGSLRSYLYRAVHARVVSRWRAARVRDAYAAQVQADESHPPTVYSLAAQQSWPDQAAQYSELQAAYWRAIAALPPRGRQAFELHRQHDLSMREIGEVMGISTRTVETHVGRALVALRRALAPYLVLALTFISR